MPMQNILALLNNLRETHWHITAFPFTYKNRNYIVLFEDLANLPLVANGYLVLLSFIDRADGNRILRVKANQYSFQLNAKEFREFFGIAYAPNLGDIFKQFYNCFNNFIPETRILTFDDQTQRAMVNKLSRNDNENISNICCYDARHNGVCNGIQHHRTPFNSDKTKLLRENLFNMLGGDDTISFFYREENPLDDLEIYNNFLRRYRHHP